MSDPTSNALRAWEQLEKDKAVRLALEAAAKRLEQEQGATAYRQAWSRAAKIIRSMKPE